MARPNLSCEIKVAGFTEQRGEFCIAKEFLSRLDLPSQFEPDGLRKAQQRAATNPPHGSARDSATPGLPCIEPAGRLDRRRVSKTVVCDTLHV
jgi:hypothetical protein